MGRRRPARGTLDRLASLAAEIRARAHAPYSRFKVGAAVAGASGRTYVGCNVENSSYGLSLCAERSAVAAAVAAGEKRIVAVAIAAGGRRPCPPCGMCRQVLAEFAAPETPVRMSTSSGRTKTVRLGALLPLPFGSDFL